MQNQAANSVRQNPSLRYLKDFAKSTLRQHRSGLPSCCGILSNLRKFSGASPDEILDTRVTLQQVQHAIALAYGHLNWVSLRDAVVTISQPDIETSKSVPRKYKLFEKRINLVRKWRAHMSHSERTNRRRIGENRITDAISKGKFNNLKGKNKPLDPTSYALKAPELPRNVDQVIGRAIKKGDFDDLPGKGKPLDLDGYFKVPKENRMAFHVLKNAGYIPTEVLMYKEIISLKEQLKTTRDEKEKGRLNREINEKMAAYDIAKTNFLK